MVCQNCGSEVSEGVKYCPFCGGPVQSESTQNPENLEDFGKEPGVVTSENNAQQDGNSANQVVYTSNHSGYNGGYQGGCNANQGSYQGGCNTNQGSYQGGYNTNQGGYNARFQMNVNPLPMKWYKFIIYVQLFLGALSNAVNGIMCLTGAHYGSGYASYVYEYYGFGLKIVDVFMGIASIGLAVIAVLVRQQMARFKKNAPMMYIVYVAVTAAISIIYTVMASIIVGSLLVDSSTFSSLISSVLIIVLSMIYFKKRQHLFVN